MDLTLKYQCADIVQSSCLSAIISSNYGFVIYYQEKYSQDAMRGATTLEILTKTLVHEYIRTLILFLFMICFPLVNISTIFVPSYFSTVVITAPPSLYSFVSLPPMPIPPHTHFMFAGIGE